MAKKQKMIVVQPPKGDKAMVVSGLEVFLHSGSGHNQPAFRTGVHDSRPRRQRTRAAQLRQALRD